MVHAALRRGGRRNHGTLVGAAVTFFAVTGPSWLLWQVLQGEDATVTRSAFPTWVSGTVLVAPSVATAGVLLCDRDVRAGIALGTVAAGAAVLVGLAVDVLTSMS